MKRVLAAATAIVAAHAAPAVAGIGPVRRRVMPRLSGQGDPAHVALTFDDGPHPEATPRLLDLLAKAGVRATFFLLGSAAERHPQVARRIADEGHEIGVHGYEHRLLIKRGPRATVDDLDRATQTIVAVTGAQPMWWRPPYGVATGAALIEAKRLELRPVLWTTWGRDWARGRTPFAIHRSVLRALDGGGTILLHDSDHAADPGCWRSMLAALPAVLVSCDLRGLTVGTLAEHGIRA